MRLRRTARIAVLAQSTGSPNRRARVGRAKRCVAAASGERLPILTTNAARGTRLRAVGSKAASVVTAGERSAHDDWTHETHHEQRRSATSCWRRRSSRASAFAYWLTPDASANTPLLVFSSPERAAGHEARRQVHRVYHDEDVREGGEAALRGRAIQGQHSGAKAGHSVSRWDNGS